MVSVNRGPSGRAISAGNNRYEAEGEGGGGGWSLEAAGKGEEATMPINWSLVRRAFYYNVKREAKRRAEQADPGVEILRSTRFNYPVIRGSGLLFAHG